MYGGSRISDKGGFLTGQHRHKLPARRSVLHAGLLRRTEGMRTLRIGRSELRSVVLRTQIMRWTNGDRWSVWRVGPRAVGALGLASLALSQIGCGSAPQFPTVGRNSTVTRAVASWPNWDKCLRNHGVSVPAGYRPGVGRVPKPDANPKVVNDCQRFQPAAGPTPPWVVRAVDAASRCMIARGFANTVIGDGQGISYAYGIGPSTPGFAASEKACGNFA